MKKLFFILILAVFASVTAAWGQSATHNSDPQATTCTDDPLHPIAGKPYTYEVSTTPSGGQYTWWATTNPVFIQSTAATPTVITMNNSGAGVLTVGGGLLSATSNYNTANASPSVGIVWSSQTLANTTYLTAPTFVAVHYTPPAGTNCADNIKVYELDPRNAFIVDIKNLDATTKATMAYGATESQCVHDVTVARYTGNHQVEYMYGYQELYFEVVAANFTGSWMPTFQFPALAGDQTMTAEWSYTTDFTGTTYPINVGTGATTSVTTNASDTSNGVSIYVKVTIINNHYETLAQQSLTFAVDGRNEAGELDVPNATCVEPAAPDFIDTAIQTIEPRPTVNGVTTGTGSTPPNVTLIPKNP